MQPMLQLQRLHLPSCKCSLIKYFSILHPLVLSLTADIPSDYAATLALVAASGYAMRCVHSWRAYHVGVRATRRFPVLVETIQLRLSKSRHLFKLLLHLRWMLRQRQRWLCRMSTTAARLPAVAALGRRLWLGYVAVLALAPAQREYWHPHPCNLPSSEDVDVSLPAMDLASPSLARW